MDMSSFEFGICNKISEEMKMDKITVEAIFKYVKWI